MKWIGIWTRMLLITGAFACNPDELPFDDNEDLVADNELVTTSEWEDWTTGATFAATDPFANPYFGGATFLTVSTEAPEDAEAAAELVADNADQYFTPAGCAEVTRSGSELTYALSDCESVFAAVNLSGKLHVSFENDGPRTTFDITSEELEVDAAAASFEGSGVYTAIGSSRTVQLSSRRALDGSGAFAGDFDSTLTWTAGSNCVTRNASGTIRTPDRTLDVVVEDYMRCGGACPTAGVITLHDQDADDEDDRSTLTFGTGDRARRQHSNGDVNEVELECD